MDQYEDVIRKLEHYEPDEIFYRGFCESQKSGSEDLFLKETKPEDPAWRSHVLHPETINPEMTEDMFFEDGRNAAVVKHPRYLPAFLHKHAFFEIVYVISGQCREVFADRTMEINEGDSCLIAPGVRHAVSVFDDSIAVNLLIRKSTFMDIFQNAVQSGSQISLFFLGSLYERKNPNYLAYHTENDQKLRNYVLDMISEEQKADEYSDRIICSLLTIFFNQLTRKYSDTVEMPDYAGKSSDLYEEILSYITENYAAVSIKNLADHFHFSEPYCSKLVKEASGSTFSKLLSSIRMRRSENLLINTQMSVEAISDQIGYKNPESFIRCFKRIYGVSPSQFRKNPTQRFLRL